MYIKKDKYQNDTIDELKFYPMLDFPGYTISYNGIMKDPNGSLVPTCYRLGNTYFDIYEKSYNAAKIVWHMFIGEVNVPIKFKDDNRKNISARNLYINFDIEEIDNDRILINDILFKKIPGFEKYVISKEGTVFSLKRRQFIIRSFNHRGYPVVPLVDKKGFRSPKKVHRMVYLTWIGPLMDNMVIDHIDDNILNPSSDNLQQLSIRDNVIKGVLHTGIYKSNRDTNDSIISLHFSDKQISEICEALENNIPYDIILAKLNLENNSDNYLTIAKLIKSIRKGIIYANIAKSYKIPDFPRYDVGKLHKVRFSNGDINFIIDQYSHGVSQSELAELFGCSQSMISLIVNANNCDKKGSETIESVS